MTASIDRLTADLRRCRRGDEIAARRLYANAGSAMELVALACTNDRADAQDVVQSALLRVLETPTERIDDVREALPWLLKITRHVALNHLRASRRRDTREHAVILGNNHSQQDENPQEDLMSAIAALEIDHREIIILRHFIGLTWTQIGETVGITDRAGAARHKVALEQLRQSMMKPRFSDRGVRQC